MLSLDSLPPLSQTIDQHSLSTRKALGQHFLLNADITNRIARYAGDVTQGSTIEVGPGPGGLTRSLLRAGATVYAIEKDERCMAILKELQAAAGGKLHVLNDDALNIDMRQFPAPRRIVANLPYNVGTELLIGWLQLVYSLPLEGGGQGGGPMMRDAPTRPDPLLHPPPSRGRNNKAFESLTLMFQKEVAERIAAAPGSKDFGRLSVLAQFLCEVRYDMELPPGAFSPPPKVSSAVVTLIPREKPLVDVKLKTLEKVVAAAFGQRRKMLRSALKPLGVDTQKLLADAGIDATLRAEQLSVETLCRLAQLYENTMR